MTQRPPGSSPPVRIASTLSAEYPQLGGNYEVLHHSQVLAQLVVEGRLTPGGADIGDVTFHDPCYLGRHSGEYDAPRALVEALPGARMLPMALEREQSFCCGAGGGRMWQEEPGTRITSLRCDQAVATGAEQVVTACPFCTVMLGDGMASHTDGRPVIEVSRLLLDGVRAGSNPTDEEVN